jgi:hypothetical protein
VVVQEVNLRSLTVEKKRRLVTSTLSGRSPRWVSRVLSARELPVMQLPISMPAYGKEGEGRVQRGASATATEGSLFVAPAQWRSHCGDDSYDGVDSGGDGADGIDGHK